jgi:acyl-CoA thioester hydrolase
VPAVTAPFVHRFRVRYSECDPQGIVFNANYVAYFDDALTELWREAFGSYQLMVERGVNMVVAHLELDFHSSARFDDMVTMETKIERLGNTGMTTRLLLKRDDELLVEGLLRHVFVAVEGWEKTEIPAWVRDGLAPYLDV